MCVPSARSRRRWRRAVSLHVYFVFINFRVKFSLTAGIGVSRILFPLSGGVLRCDGGFDIVLVA